MYLKRLISRYLEVQALTGTSLSASVQLKNKEQKPLQHLIDLINVEALDDPSLHADSERQTKALYMFFNSFLIFN